MADPQMVPSGEGWSGVAGFVTALGAMVAVFVRGKGAIKKDDLHGLRNKVNDTTLKVAVLDSRYGDIDRRLGSIEKGQERVLEKLEDVLRQR